MNASEAEARDAFVMVSGFGSGLPWVLLADHRDPDAVVAHDLQAKAIAVFGVFRQVCRSVVPSLADAFLTQRVPRTCLSDHAEIAAEIAAESPIPTKSHLRR